MRLFIVLSFLVLGWAYWALSGGAAFAPEPWPVEAVAQAVPEPQVGVPTEVEAATEVVAPDEATSGVVEQALAAPGAAGPAVPSGPVPPVAPTGPVSPGDALAAIAPDAPAAESPAPVPTPAPTPPATEVADLRTVTGDRVNLRDGPGPDFAVAAQLRAGETAEVLGESGGWTLVRLPDGVEGWMATRFLSPGG